LGPSKGLMVAAEDGAVPAWMKKTNRFNAPVGVLFTQAILFLIICGAFLYMPTVSSTYWILSNITAILSLIAYFFMFAAVIKLRYSHPTMPRAYRIPGGNFGVWLVGIVGSLSCLVTIVIGFWPPIGVDVGNLTRYETLLIGGVVVFMIVPFVVYSLRKRFN